jgi:hypothetical protein
MAVADHINDALNQGASWDQVQATQRRFGPRIAGLRFIAANGALIVQLSDGELVAVDRNLQTVRDKPIRRGRP